MGNLSVNTSDGKSGSRFNSKLLAGNREYRRLISLAALAYAEHLARRHIQLRYFVDDKTRIKTLNEMKVVINGINNKMNTALDAKPTQYGDSQNFRNPLFHGSLRVRLRSKEIIDALTGLSSIMTSCSAITSNDVKDGYEAVTEIGAKQELVPTKNWMDEFEQTFEFAQEVAIALRGDAGDATRLVLTSAGLERFCRRMILGWAPHPSHVWQLAIRPKPGEEDSPAKLVARMQLSSFARIYGIIKSIRTPRYWGRIEAHAGSNWTALVSTLYSSFHRRGLLLNGQYPSVDLPSTEVCVRSQHDLVKLFIEEAL